MIEVAILAGRRSADLAVDRVAMINGGSPGEDDDRLADRRAAQDFDGALGGAVNSSMFARVPGPERDADCGDDSGVREPRRPGRPPATIGMVGLAPQVTMSRSWLEVLVQVHRRNDVRADRRGRQVHRGMPAAR